MTIENTETGAMTSEQAESILLNAINEEGENKEEVEDNEPSAEEVQPPQDEADISEEIEDEQVEAPQLDDAQEIPDDAKFKIGDEIITGKDLKDQREMRKAFTQKTMALADERRAFEAEKATELAKIQQERLATLRPEILDNLKAVDPLLVAAQNTDWDRLRYDNPAEWAALRQEVAQREAEWDDYYQSIQSQQQEIALQTRQELILREQAALEAAIPEVITNTDAVLSEITNIGKQYGLSEQELADITDHRFVKMAYDLAKLQKREAALKGMKADKPIAPSIRPTITAKSIPNKDKSNFDPEIAKLAKRAGNDRNAEAKLLDRISKQYG